MKDHRKNKWNDGWGPDDHRCIRQMQCWISGCESWQDVNHTEPLLGCRYRHVILRDPEDEQIKARLILEVQRLEEIEDTLRAELHRTRRNLRKVSRDLLTTKSQLQRLQEWIDEHG